MRDLVLHLKSCYFHEIKEDRKHVEYRLTKPYWQKRLAGRSYDRVVIWDAYKPRSAETVIVFPWRGYDVQYINHPQFCARPEDPAVKVFTIWLLGRYKRLKPPFFWH
jgi:hypothetical protein